ncbi:hypothetical protein Ancab_008195, partial [Ancistrocladus abbreviatus]
LKITNGVGVDAGAGASSTSFKRQNRRGEATRGAVFSAIELQEAHIKKTTRGVFDPPY